MASEFEFSLVRFVQSLARLWRFIAPKRGEGGKGVSENEALEKGLKEKSAEFAKAGAEIYSKA